ncbi:hypothetical protein HAX54_016929 [Datura stramonium]|uniref:Uncharacterized protein n=1 Tax=Datura stramonium TaxID=4076 RepID=A0ABS8RJS5_DATST|nr:hypothetical protein [Datura stramonium]
MKTNDIDISLILSRLMREAKKVKFGDIIDGSLINVKKEDSKYYQKLVLSKEKEFNFLVKIQDLKSAKEERSINLIVVDMHEVEKDVAIVEIEEDDTSTKLINKRTKKDEDNIEEEP